MPLPSGAPCGVRRGSRAGILGGEDLECRSSRRGHYLNQESLAEEEKDIFGTSRIYSFEETEGIIVTIPRDVLATDDRSVAR